MTPGPGRLCHFGFWIYVWQSCTLASMSWMPPLPLVLHRFYLKPPHPLQRSLGRPQPDRDVSVSVDCEPLALSARDMIASVKR